MRETSPIRLFAWAFLLTAPILISSPSRPAFADDPPVPPTPPAMEGGGTPGMDGGDGAAMDGGGDVGADTGDTADGPVPFLEQVNKAIDKGVEWLKQKQLKDGSWGDITSPVLYNPEAKGEAYKHPAGTTALALYTLLKCKVPAEDPVVVKGFNFIRTRYYIPQGSYELSMSILAVTATADPFKTRKASTAAGDRVKLSVDNLKWVQKLKDALLKKRRPVGWRYNQDGMSADGKTRIVAEALPGGQEDLSSTQLACLAMFTADRCGVPVPKEVWSDMVQFAKQHQQEDGPEVERAIHPKAVKAPDKKPKADDPGGRYAQPPEKPVKDKARGFSYINKPDEKPPLPDWEAKPTGSMTGCGLGVLMMARHILSKTEEKLWKQCSPAVVQQMIYDGFAWLNENWDATYNPPHSGGNTGNYNLYYFYSVERAMDLTGNFLLGKHDWYVEMGQTLISIQDPKGFWMTNTTHSPKDVLDTCFALLFLKRATRGGIPYPTITGGTDAPPTDGRSSGGGDDK